jgi:aspartyl-tRNA synthetase
MHAYRTHTCGELRKAQMGETARLSGWIHRKRDHGGLLFVDLRDHYGLTQCVLEELPLPVFGEPDYPEEVRLKYRFLDLRRETLHRNIVTRTKDHRRHAPPHGRSASPNMQTPILTASSPEGARDFLVPSRIHPGQFYALPQAPQQYKQLLMVSGFDRYFQIAPCFRDEDPRADRLPGEFYQLDLEMSFVTQEDVWDTMEPVIRGVFEEFAEGKPDESSAAFPMTKRCANMAPTSRICATRSRCRPSPSISPVPASRSLPA